MSKLFCSVTMEPAGIYKCNEDIFITWKRESRKWVSMSKRKIGVNPTPEKQPKELFTSTKLFSRNNLVALAIIVGAAALLLWRTTSNGFTDWDDDLYVVNSELIKKLD